MIVDLDIEERNTSEKKTRRPLHRSFEEDHYIGHLKTKECGSTHEHKSIFFFFKYLLVQQ